MIVNKITNNGIEGYQIIDAVTEYFLTQETEEKAIAKYNEIIANKTKNELVHLKEQKERELSNNLETNLKQGFATTINNIKADCTFDAITKQSLGLQMYQLEDKQDTDIVIFCDYNNKVSQITLADYKELVKQTGKYYKNYWAYKWQKRAILNTLETKEEIEAFNTEI